jgi:hypothetical protein
MVLYKNFQENYQFRFHTNFLIKGFIIESNDTLVFDRKGNVYALGDPEERERRRAQSNGIQRDVTLTSRTNIGRINQIIEVNTSLNNYHLCLVRSRANLALINFWHFFEQSWIVYDQRDNLEIEPNGEVTLICSGNYFFYASYNTMNSRSNRKIYYNILQSLNRQQRDSTLELVSGDLVNLMVLNDFLLASTSSMHIEVFSVSFGQKVFEIDVGYPPLFALIYKKKLVIITYENYLITRSMPIEDQQCMHCDNAFRASGGWKICRHYLPPKI